MKIKFMEKLRQRLEEIALAITFLTRIPLPRFDVQTKATLSSSFWAFPLAGLIAGALSTVTLMLAIAIGLPSSTSAILALLTLTIATGALHEDGLADMADGIGGGHTIERRLEIMRDSRIGTYGAVALMAAAALSATLLMNLVATTGISYVAQAFIIATALSRLAIAIPLAILKPARRDGLAADFPTPNNITLTTAILWPAVLAVAVLGSAGLAAVLGSAVGGFTITAIAQKYLHGTTGDVFGAAVIVSFTTALIGITLAT